MSASASALQSEWQSRLRAFIGLEIPQNQDYFRARGRHAAGLG